MAARARISDKRANELLDQIALQNTIIREVQAIIASLDPDTLAFNSQRLNRIIRSAGVTKQGLIAQMELEKEAARAGRENGH